MKKSIIIVILFQIMCNYLLHAQDVEKYWSVQLGTSSDDYGFGVATDASGNIYITGCTKGELDGNTNAGSDDMFLVKFNSSGVKQWTNQLGTSSEDVSRGVTADSSGNIYVVGYTYGGLDGNTSAGSSDMFLIKYHRLTMATENINKPFCYPNPYNPSQGLTKIMFTGLAIYTDIKIFTLSGELVREIRENTPFGLLSWDTKNYSGDKVASGVYFYCITDGTSNKKTGKLAIIR